MKRKDKSNSEFSVGSEFSARSGNKYSIQRLIGEGGQGCVYEASCEGENYALKWYKTGTQGRPEQKEIIENLIRRAKPSEAFLWPIDLIEHGDEFGYVMPLRPSGYLSIPALLSRKAEPSFMTICKIGYNLVANYRKLHASGYSYCDINFGNVFFDAETGDVLICDNDNVTIDGMRQSLAMGTIGFMAPELVMACENHTSERPSTVTDLHSLAVLLFYLFMIADPFQGELVNKIRCYDLAAKVQIYGKNPVFIFDPVDKSNRPVKGIDDNAIIFWNLYPDYFKDLFVRTFTDGLHSPKKRVQEIEWQNAIIKMMDEMMTCQNCGAEVFYNPLIEKSHAAHTCWFCGNSLCVPAKLEIGDMTILLNSESKISEHHIKRNYNMEKTVARITRHPTYSNVWGLKNESTQNWIYENSNGEQQIVKPGKSATVSHKAKILFGEATGVFRTKGEQ